MIRILSKRYWSQIALFWLIFGQSGVDHAKCKDQSSKNVAKDFEGKAKVGKLEVDQNPTMAQKYGIMSIPTLLIFKGGEVVDQIIGAVPAEMIKEKLDNVL